MINSVHQNGNGKIPLLDKIGYGSGDFASGVAMQVVGAYLVFYCTTILGLPGTWVGIAVSLSVFWDAVSDPLMGYFSDITRSKKFGRRHIYLFIGGIGMALSNFILWNIPLELSEYVKYVIILIDILIIKTFMTIYITPYTALGAELSNDYDERTSIQGIRTIFFLLGLAFVTVVGMYFFFKGTPEYEMGQLNPAGYNTMGLYTSLIVVAFAFISLLSTKKYIPNLNEHIITNENTVGVKNLFLSFKKIVRNKNFLYIALTYMFINIASVLLSSMGLHVFTFTFSLDSTQIALVVGAQFLTSILSQPVWDRISRKLDKKPTMMLGLTICIIGTIFFMILVLAKDFASGSTVYFVPFAAIVGFGMGGLFSLPPSMVADVIDLDELDTGKRNEGTYFGFFTFTYKTSQSITLIFLGILLDIVGFNSDLPEQAESTVLSLGLILSVGCALAFALALFSAKHYSLTRLMIAAIQKQIAQNKAAGIL